MSVINTLYRQHFGTEASSVEKLPVSGSHRTYSRLRGPVTVIGVEGTDFDENKAFITISRHFRVKGINVPEIYAVSGDGMCYLQEDLGTLSLFDAVAAGRASGKYDEKEKQLLLKAVRALPKLQFEGAQGLDWSVCYPQERFDGRMVDFDLNYFKYDFLKIVGAEFNEVLLQDDFDKFREDLLSVDSDTFLYRDFQGRNIMLRDGEPWFIDYQGGRRGPFYYDLASFVYQASARYDESLRRELTEAYREELARYADVSEERFRREFRLFVLFRILQVLGCYGFRGLVEKKRYFIDSIPPALANLRSLLPFPEYPYLSGLLETLAASPSFSPADPSGPQERPVLQVDVYSFSFKKGIPEDTSGNGGGYVFDCRAVHNPGRYDRYKTLNGLDEPVIRFLEEDGEITRFLRGVFEIVDAHVERFLQRGFTHMQVSFGCTGGQHRSAYSAEHLSAHIKEKFPEVKVKIIHRELGIQKEI